MSSSSKKKLRKEQATANLTEKQIAAKKEEKQLKVYTAVFWVVLGLCFCLVAGMALRSPVTGLVTKASTGAVVGEHKLSGVELNYFYIDAINNYCNQYGDYLQYFLDTSKPIGEQFYEEESKTTWADEFLRMATDSIKNNYALYDAAKAAGHTLSEDEKAAAEDLFKQLKEVSKSYGYPTANGYLKAMYGKGASVSSYRDYYEVTTLASSYYTAYTEQLKNGIDDAALREFEADKLYQYNSYSYATLYLNVDTYKQGGTKGEDDKITYSDDEKKAALAAAEEAANSLLGASSALLFNRNVKRLEINAENDNAAITTLEDVYYSDSKIPAAVRDWLAEGEHKQAEMAVVPNTVTSTDAEGNELSVTSGYYVIFFESVNDNASKMSNVRHLLVAFEGGTTDSNGKTVYTDAEKAAAKEKADKLLKEWMEGDATEESFAALATEHTDDDGSKATGGLYEDINEDTTFVEPFLTWALADHKPGDTEIVETEYSYHIMYYSSTDELTYRDALISTTLKNKDIENWYNGIVDAATVKEGDTSKLRLDLVLTSAS